VKFKLLLIIGFLAVCSGCDQEATVETPDPEAEIWWNHDVFYEIFVRSFYDSNGDGIGDLQGVIQKLDYLNDGNPNTSTDLGVTGIWLMPIQPSPSYHGYDVVNYTAVNPDYGTLSDVQQLVSQAHARGIKVIIDFVVNHTSDQHPWFLGSTNTRSDKRPYYVWSNAQSGNGWVFRSGAYYYAYFWGGMPDLNYRTERVTKEMLAVADFWDQTAGVDGFRMDAIPYLIEEGDVIQHTPSTMKWLRDFWIKQKQRNPAFMLVGEVWFPTNDVVPYTDKRMDYCFEFDLAGSIIGAVGSGNVLGLKSKMNQVLAMYPERQYGVFLSNHDQNRIIETLSLDVNKAKMAAAIMLTLPGVPYIYYGEEIGMRGVKPDEDIRRPMQWSSEANAGFTTGPAWRAPDPSFVTSNVDALQQDPNSIWNHYRKLIDARSKSLTLRQGLYDPIDSPAEKIFSFLIVNGNEGVLAVHNVSSADIATSLSATATRLLPGNFKATDMLTGESLGTITAGAGGKWENVSVAGTLGAYSTRLIRLEAQ
jgi:alpha-amylase